MDVSINKLNTLISTKLTNINSNLKFSLLIYAKRVSQLVYIKFKDIEQVINQNNEDNFMSDELSEIEEEQFNHLKKELFRLQLFCFFEQIEKI